MSFDTTTQSMKPNTAHYVVIADNRPQGPSTQPPLDLAQGSPTELIRPLRPLAPGEISPPGGILTVLSNVQVCTVDHLHVGFNSYYTNILDSNNGEEHKQLGLSRTTEDIPFNTDSDSGDDSNFLTNPEEARTPVAPDAVIESFNSEWIKSSSRDFSLVTGRKYRNTHRQMRA